jgi:hypothetical protein
MVACKVTAERGLQLFSVSSLASLVYAPFDEASALMGLKKRAAGPLKRRNIKFNSFVCNFDPILRNAFLIIYSSVFLISRFNSS